MPDPDIDISDMLEIASGSNLSEPSAVWVDPKTNAKLFIGGEYAAKSKPLLERMEIFNIVCAKGSSGPLYHYSDPKFTYLAWHINSLPWMKPYLKTDE